MNLFFDISDFRQVEFERRSSGFFAKGREKDRKKLLDTILRQLRTLASQ